MADAKVWKVHAPDGHMTASAEHAEDAAALVSLTPGRCVKRAGRIVYRWPEDLRLADAPDSYDAAGELMMKRHRENMRERFGGRD